MFTIAVQSSASNLCSHEATVASLTVDDVVHALPTQQSGTSLLMH